VNIQRLFGSQRALRSVEDFTEFEQRAAYFDGDPVIAQKKGVNILDRGSQVHAMAEFQELLDFPPAPKLDVFGKLDRTQASAAELRGQQVFCHLPHATLLHRQRHAQPEGGTLLRAADDQWPDGRWPHQDLPLARNQRLADVLHDGRLLTPDDTVEFFNLVLRTKLTETEKKDLVAFVRAL
jgi:hypothetical protein